MEKCKYGFGFPLNTDVWCPLCTQSFPSPVERDLPWVGFEPITPHSRADVFTTRPPSVHGDERPVRILSLVGYRKQCHGCLELHPG